MSQRTIDAAAWRNSSTDTSVYGAVVRHGTMDGSNGSGPGTASELKAHSERCCSSRSTAIRRVDIMESGESTQPVASRVANNCELVCDLR